MRRQASGCRQGYAARRQSKNIGPVFNRPDSLRPRRALQADGFFGVLIPPRSSVPWSPEHPAQTLTLATDKRVAINAAMKRDIQSPLPLPRSFSSQGIRLNQADFRRRRTSGRKAGASGRPVPEHLAKPERAKDGRNPAFTSNAGLPRILARFRPGGAEAAPSARSRSGARSWRGASPLPLRCNHSKTDSTVTVAIRPAMR